MKIAIIGSRKLNIKTEEIKRELEKITELKNIKAIVSGGAAGADQAAKTTAKKLNIKYIEYKPEYNKYPNKIAPLERNKEIIENSDFILAFWDGTSKGTQHALKEAKKQGKTTKTINKNYTKSLF